MTIAQLVKEINNSNLNSEDLRILNELVVRKAKALRKAESTLKSASLYEGMVVRINHEQLAGQTATITKIKRTKCDIKITSTGRQYTVPMSLVQSL